MQLVRRPAALDKLPTTLCASPLMEGKTQARQRRWGCMVRGSDEPDAGATRDSATEEGGERGEGKRRPSGECRIDGGIAMGEMKVEAR